jgi:hypothetical protein
MRHRRREELDWGATHPDIRADKAVYAREILPRLKGLSLAEIAKVTGLSLAEIAKVTGLSQQYCSLMRQGLKVPHPRYWEGVSQHLLRVQSDMCIKKTGAHTDPHRDARLILWTSLHKRLGRAGDEVRVKSYIASAGSYPGLSAVALVVPA